MAENSSQDQEDSKPAGVYSSAFYANLTILLLSFLGFITRAYAIHFPGEVVFDEVHFGKFASYYLRGEYYFDVHPPLGKYFESTLR